MKNHITNLGERAPLMTGTSGLGDLFRWQDRYPNQPAARGTETSRAAAESARPRAESVREQCLTRIQENGPLTADEVADLLHESVLYIRPRIAELHKSGKIADSGKRRQNTSGQKAIAWAAVAATKN